MSHRRIVSQVLLTPAAAAKAGFGPALVAQR